MGIEDLSGKLGLDTTDFKTAIVAANRQLRVLESGFRSNAAALGDWGKDASGLEMRMKSLTEQIDIQKAKVGALEEEYKRVAKEKGDTSRAAQDLQIKLNRETETLNRMQRELTDTRSDLDQMTKSSDKLGDETKKTSKGMDTLKSAASKLGAGLKALIKISAAVVGALVGIGAGLAKLVSDTAHFADDLLVLSDQTGISTERLQELGYIGDQVGTDLDTMTSSLSRMIRSMYDAAQEQEDFNKALGEMQPGDEAPELGEMAKAFKELGISVVDSSGNLRNSEEIFTEVLTQLGKIENPTLRDALAMEIFGRSAMELNPLIKAGADEMERLAQEAHAVGAVMSEEDVAAAADFADQLDGLKAGLLGTVRTLGVAFMPGFKSILDQVGGYVQEFGEIVRGGNGDLSQITNGLLDLIVRIATDIAEQSPKMLQAGLSILKSIIQGIINSLPTLSKSAIDIIRQLLFFILDNLPMLVDAGIKILLSLIQGITGMLPELIPVIAQVIVQILQILVENLPLLIDAGVQLLLALIDGLVQALPLLIEYTPEILNAIMNAIIEALPVLADAGMQIIGALIQAIIDNWPALRKSAEKTIEYFAKAAIRMAWTLWTVGKSILEGIWKGIQDNASAFTTNILEFFQGIVDGIKELLGISSPSKVFGEIGENSGLSYVSGLVKALSGAKDLIKNEFGQLATTFSPQLAPALMAAPAGGPAASGAVFHVTITQNFPDYMTTPDEWKRQVAQIARKESEDGVIMAFKHVRNRRSIYGG